MAGNLLFNMQKDGTGTDVSFIVEGLTIPAHKLVLTAHSGPLVDTLEKDGNVIHIEDVSARVFQSIIQYLHAGENTVSPSNAFEILHAAKKFGIKELEDQCVTIIATKLNNDNFLAYSQEAIDFDSKEFLSSCKEYAKQNISAIVMQPALKDIHVSIEVLELICSLEGTNSELAIFAACVSWAEEECKRQKLEESPETMWTVLGNVLDKIKFEDMALDDFIKYVVPEGILTNEKVGQLINRWQKDKKEKDWKEAFLVNEAWRKNVKKMEGKLGKKLYQMQQDGADTEVTFVVEANDIPCHKLVIMANGGSLAEQVGKGGNVITVQDISLRTFKSIIQYLYTGECPVSPANAFEILHAAKKFGIKELEEEMICSLLDKNKFEDMAMDDFVEFVVPEGILTDEKVGQLINRWQKDKKKKNWNETIRVTIWDPSSSQWTETDLPLRTRIRDIKKMRIFNYGKLQGPGNKYTLGYWNGNDGSYETVPDSTSLASIKEEGEDCIVLRVYEMTCRAKHSKGRWEIPVTFTYSDLWNKRTDEAIRDQMAKYYYITRDYDIRSARIKKPSPIIPGSTFIVTAERRCSINEL